MAVGTVTITEERLSNTHKITFAWTSGTAGEAGTASGTTTYTYNGAVLRVVTVPGLAPNVPTDDYDLTLTDEDGVDVAVGQLANRDDTNTEMIATGMGYVVGDKLTLTVAAAGAAKTGTCYVYIGTAADVTDPVADVENALYGTAGIAAFPAAAAAANNVSLAEVLRYIQETQIGALTNTGGTASLTAILGNVSNSSVATRLTTLAAQTSGGRQIARRSYSFAVDAGAQGSLVMFTVSGTVLVEVFGVCQTSLTTGGGAATVELGIAGNTAALIAQTVATTIDQYQTWQDATPEANPGPVDVSARSFVITNGADIEFKIATADLTAGIIDFYCLWTPLSAGATVVAA